MKFTEAQLEQAFIDLLGKEVYPHVLGEQISRALEEVLIKEDLQAFLLQHYAKENIMTSEVERIIKKFRSILLSDNVSLCRATACSNNERNYGIAFVLKGRTSM